MPIHPLSGALVSVVRFERNYQHGGRYVVIDGPRGGALRLPIEWTDRGPPWVPPVVDGRPVRLAVRGLLLLARMVEAVKARPLAQLPSGSPQSSSGPHDGKEDATTSLANRADESFRRRSSRSARRMGDTRAQKASGSKPQRGGRQ